MARPKINKKKKSTTIYLQPEILEKYKEYCDKNDIENYSIHIEKLLNDNKDVSDEDVLEYLKSFRFRGEVWGVDEPEIIFAQEPILRVSANLIEAQIIEKAG